MNFILALFCLSLSQVAFGSEISAQINHIYVPEGFDDNDYVQVVVEGSLPSTCFQLRATEVKKSELSETQYLLRQTAVELNDTPCLQVESPFFQIMDLGVLKKNDYRLTTDSGVTTVLHVQKAPTTTQDDYLYAPIQDTFVVGHNLYLKGVFPSGCQTFKEVKVLTYGDVIVVQPIMGSYSVQVNQSRPLCAAVETPFLRKVALPQVSGKYLIHVRTANGRSINKVENL